MLRGEHPLVERVELLVRESRGDALQRSLKLLLLCVQTRVQVGWPRCGRGRYRRRRRGHGWRWGRAWNGRVGWRGRLLIMVEGHAFGRRGSA